MNSKLAEPRALLETPERLLDKVVTWNDADGPRETQVGDSIKATWSGREDVEQRPNGFKVQAHEFIVGKPSGKHFSAKLFAGSFEEVVGVGWDEGIEVLSATPQLIQLIARCDRRTADRLIQFIHEVPDLPLKEREAVGMAFREMLMNAIEHGAHFKPTQHVAISYIRAKQMVLCRVKDPGEGFSFEELSHAAVSNPPSEPIRHEAIREEKGLRPGGFGILLTKNIIDELIYGETGNEVVLIKYLKPNQLDD